MQTINVDTLDLLPLQQATLRLADELQAYADGLPISVGLQHNLTGEAARKCYKEFVALGLPADNPFGPTSTGDRNIRATIDEILRVIVELGGLRCATLHVCLDDLGEVSAKLRRMAARLGKHD